MARPRASNHEASSFETAAFRGLVKGEERRCKSIDKGGKLG
jgi:hypothetical protein